MMFNRITALRGASAIVCLMLMLTLPVAAQTPTAAARPTVVYHIDDSRRAIPLIRSIGNHRRADADIRIIVVALSAGVDFLVEGAADDRGNSYDALVDPLMLEGVEFRVCGNTLTGRQIDAATLLPDVTVVPSGVAEIARLQIEEGAAYIKP
jgi:intracellular sulfur oxidation DsrE/DsrF family protein